MANKGLKEENTMLSFEIADIKVYIDLAYANKNVIAIIPLGLDLGPQPIRLNIFYNDQNKNVGDLDNLNINNFGNGYRLSTYKKVEYSNDKYYITNCDGATNEYTYYDSDDDWICYQDILTKSRFSIDYGEDYDSYEIRDKHNNFMELDHDDLSKITRIVKCDEYDYDITYTLNTMTVFSSTDSFILTSSNNKVTSYSYVENNSTKYYGYISYADDRLTKIEIKNSSNQTVRDIRIDYSNGIKFIDYITKEMLDVQISTTAINVLEGYSDDNDTVLKRTIITYDNYKTVVTDYDLIVPHDASKDITTTYLFDDNYLLEEIIDKNNFVSGVKYNNNIKKVMYSTESIYLPSTSSEIKNLINYQPQTDETYIKSMSLVTSTPTAYTNILSNMCRNITSGYIKYTKSLKGISGEAYSLVLWIKRTSDSPVGNGHLEIKFNLGDKEDSIYLESYAISERYRMIVLSLTSYETFESLEFEINITGTLKLEFGRLEIFNNNLKTKYEYENTNIVGKENGEYNSYNSYNYNNMVDGSYGNNINTTMTTYGYHNLVSSEIMPYGVLKKYYYNNDSQITNKQLKVNDSTIWQENYSYSNKDLQTFINKYNESASFTYQNHNLTKVTIGNNNNTRYWYNRYNDVTAVSKNTSYYQTITYDDYRNITKVTLLNDSKYKYFYDAKKRVNEIIFQEATYEKYTYDDNSLLTSIQKGDKITRFSYDDYKLISKIELVDENNILYKEFDFDYDNKKRIKYVKIPVDNNYQIIKEYIYDNQDNLINIKYYDEDSLLDFKLDYIYHQNKEAYKIYNRNENKIYTECIGINNSISKNPLYFENYIRNTTNLMGTSYNYYDLDLHGKNSNSNYYEVVSGDNPLDLRNKIYCLNTYNNTEIIGYKGPSQSNNRAIGIAMWIYPVGIVDENPIFDICENDTNNTIRVSCFIDNYKIKVKIKNLNNNYQEILESTFFVYANRWQFVGFSYKYDSGNHIYYLNFDGRTQKFESNNSAYDIGSISTPNYHIGYSRDCHYIPKFAGYITALSISNGNVITKEDLDTYYKFSKEFIIKPDDTDGSVNTSSTLEYKSDLLANYDIIPLHSNVISLKGKRPIKYNYLSSGRFVHNNFNYNKELKNMSYSLSEELAYDYNIINSGTVIINCFIESFSGKDYLIKNDGYSKASLYLLNGELVFEYKSDFYGDLETIYTDIHPTLNEWHIIGLSFRNVNHHIYYNIYFDNTVIDNENSPISIYNDMGEMLTTIGQECDGNHTLYGTVQMAVISQYFLEKNNYTSFKNNLAYYSSLNKYDKYNHLFKKEINKNRTNLLTTTFTYDKDRIISQTSNTIQKTYSYNEIGNISQITDNVTYNHTYGYDNLNRIIKFDNTTTDYYSYDSEGNILRAGNTSFTYDSETKMLKHINNDPITYSSDNPTLPIHYKNTDFEWLGTKLSKATVEVSEEETVEITFEYNEQGLRSKKIEKHTIVDEDNETYIYSIDYGYYYDEQNRLIHETRGSNRYDYLYDEDGIYGYVVNLNARFYYIKDAIGQIIGIVNEEGTIIGRYDYDPYGNIYINSASPSNKIRYKGYYYDDYVDLYYLKTRYYSPKWHRFISPDSVDYLDIYNLNGINLYSYCNNNPVMGIDPTGHWALLLLGLMASLYAVLCLRGDSKDSVDISEVTYDDLNINNNNSKGKIVVTITDANIHIKDSYLVDNFADRKRVIELIMSSEYYKKYGYERSDLSLLAEWNAHNFAYPLPFGPVWKEQTGSVDLNKNAQDDPYWLIYWLFL